MRSKKILFIISNLETGGVSKALTSLMNVIDRQRYDVSLMIVYPHGAFMELLPDNLRIITNPEWAALASRTGGIKTLLKLRRPLLAIGHCLRLALSLVSKSAAAELMARLMPSVNEEFDAIVDFNGQQQLYYMVRKLHAPKKLTFFHSDYKKWSYYYRSDKKYFAHVHSIWTISPTCVKSLQEMFPQHSAKVRLLENITSLAMIDRMATQPTAPEISRHPALLTIGHLSDLKGTHWAIEAASILRNSGIDFHWYFIGHNPDAERYNALCESFGVSKYVSFLGIKVNPYAYMACADIIVHPSQFEGRSIALDEAKLLCKPIVVTNFTTVNDQFTNGVNASVCQMSPQDIADAIMRLIGNPDLRAKYIDNLSQERHDNSSEIQKLYDAFNEEYR